MKKQTLFFKKLLVNLLILTLIFSQNTFILADEIISAETLSTETSNIESLSYPNTKKLAKTKSKLLASLLGATSVQYALIDNENITISGQSGIFNKNSNESLTNESMYGIASISKLFTTTCIMLLVEQGKIDLDEYITKYIPEFTMADERYKQITVRMLLNHSSGIYGSSFNNTILYNDNNTYYHDNLLKTLSKQTLKSNPGEINVYCNDGFVLAEIIVERVSKMSFTEFLNTYIEKPLELKNTKTVQDDFDTNKLAHIYDTGNSYELGVENFNAIGTGGIYSTAEDLCKFSNIFMNNSTFLSENSKNEITKSQVSTIYPSNDEYINTFGLGLDNISIYPLSLYNIKAVSKGGDSIYYHSSLIILPELNIAVAIISVGSNSSINQVLGQEIILSYLQEKETITKIKKPKKFSTKKSKMPKNFTNYSGIYGNIFSLSEIIINDDGTLIIKDLSTNNYKLYSYTKEKGFVSSDGRDYINFEKQANGETYLFNKSQTLIAGIGTMYSGIYAMQKINENILSKSLNNLWKSYNNKTYFLVSEPYNSVYYTNNGQPYYTLNIKNGYLGSAKIINKTTAIAEYQIPYQYGRDNYIIELFTKNNINYLNQNNYTFISEDNIKKLANKTNIKIKNDGYAVWYKINKKLNGKKLSVTVPKNASFAVYNSNMICEYYSLMKPNKKITLKSGGYIVFIGDINSKFSIKYSK